MWWFYSIFFIIIVSFLFILTDINEHIPIICNSNTVVAIWRSASKLISERYRSFENHYPPDNIIEISLCSWLSPMKEVFLFLIRQFHYNSIQKFRSDFLAISLMTLWNVWMDILCPHIDHNILIHMLQNGWISFFVTKNWLWLDRLSYS